MAFQVAFSDLQRMTLARVDELNAQFIQTPDLQRLLNLSLGKFYDIIVQKYEDYFLTIGPPFATVSNQDLYPLPADMFKFRGFELQADALHWVTVYAYEFVERNDYSYWPTAWYVSPAGTSVRYRMQGYNIKLIPIAATGGYNGRFQYVPICPQLVNNADTFDFIEPGWEEAVVCDTAIKILNISEQDCTVLMAQYQDILHRIESAASDRDAGAPKHMISSRRRDRYGNGPRGYYNY